MGAALSGPRSLATLATRYALFAVVATGVNLASQAATLRLYAGPFALLAALAVGTLAGLVAKYLLDKRWIFFDASRGPAAHARRFSLYTLTGAFTTAIFWGSELAAAAVTASESGRLLGGTIGLTIGYVIKYRLDRRFVFPTLFPEPAP